MYNKDTNPDGVVRDHMVSRRYGYDNNIPPEIIGHPANCQFLSHRDNLSKGAGCSLTYEQLLTRIALWDNNSCANLQDQKFIKPQPPKIKTEPKIGRPKQPKQQIYKWVLQHINSGQICETDNIVKWLKSKSLSSGVVYGKNATWKILEKWNLKYGKRII